MARKKTKSAKKNGGRACGSGPKLPGEPQIPNWFTISDVEQLKSIANPLRLKILGEFSDKARTTKQVAQRLGEPPTRLYHHVDALVNHGLLILQKESPKRGTTEKYYRAVAHQIRVDESCLAEPVFAHGKARVIKQMLDTIRHGFLNALDNVSDDTKSRHTTAAAGIVELSEEQIEEFSNSFLTILDQWSKKGAKGKRKSGSTHKYHVAILIYPERAE